MLLLNWTLITCRKVSLLFSPEDTASVISNKNVKFGLSDHWTLFLFESILNEPWLTGHDGASGPCSHMALFLHDRAAEGTADCVYRWWFLEVFLGPFINVNDRIMPMTDAVSSEGLRPCPLHTEIYPVSLNLLMMLCTVDDEIYKVFAVWRWGMFLKYSTIFVRTLSQIGEPLPIFTSERLCL